MGVSIELWRARIGGYGGSGCIQFHSRGAACYCFLIGLLPSLYLFAIILLLLVIGNIELNPGPPNDLKACSSCIFKAKTASEHILHQQVHSGTYSFLFVCPYVLCEHMYISYDGVSRHLDQHNVSRNEVRGLLTSFKCDLCNEPVPTNKDYIYHLRSKHLQKNEEICCPYQKISDCTRKDPFKIDKQFGVHLSQCHPGWRSDFRNSLACTDRSTVENEGLVDPRLKSDFTVPLNTDPTDDDPVMQIDSDSDSSDSDFDFLNNQCDGIYGFNQVVAYLANFYALLEGKLIVPTTTVDVIAKRLAFISEVLQTKLTTDLRKALESTNLSEEKISTVIESVLSMDPLYNSHHRSAPGVSLLTHHTRTTYYKENFQYIQPTEINLNKNPLDTENTIQYVHC